MGVDTHKDTHLSVAKDQLGRHLGQIEIVTTARGYRDLLEWAQSHGEVEAWGIEGTGSYGAGLCRFLRGADQAVIEINRPDRKARRLKGKSDPVDAEAAARAVLSGEASAVPKSSDDRVEMIRVLRATRSSAMKARTQAINSLKGLVVSAPEELRHQLRELTAIRLVRRCARLRPGDIVDPLAATKQALRSLAIRYEALEAEIKILDPELNRLTSDVAPGLVELFGVGPEVAAALLVAAGDNPERIHSEAAFAHLCGVAPIEASSGKTVRHRLNRGGDRQANSALYRVVIVRLGYDVTTKAYVERRTAEGKSKAEIIRCLKRYVAREVFAVLKDLGRESVAHAA
jgi:transposase